MAKNHCPSRYELTLFTVFCLLQQTRVRTKYNWHQNQWEINISPIQLEPSIIGKKTICQTEYCLIRRKCQTYTVRLLEIQIKISKTQMTQKNPM
jgi:hypothetical protein